MKNRKLTMNIGIISFMIVFVILCLVTFAILSLVSANSNLAMTNQRITHTSDTYQLSSHGEKKLEMIDQRLYELYEEASSSQEYFVLLDEWLDEDLHVEGNRIQFNLVENDLKLHAELEVLYPGEMLYRIVSWKITPAEEWNPDHGLDVY